MGIFAGLVQALDAAPRVRVATPDPNDGSEIKGEVIGEVSETHVSMRAEDGLVFQIAKATLRFLDPMEVAS